jgi:transmembrane sensor
VGEQRTVPLADGSIIVLNTATELRLHYGVDRREVELVHGQASFDVAKDVRRPFIVRAGRGEVRALGTVFDVYRSSDTVTVTLIEGAVAVTPDSGEVVLAPGEQLTFADGSGPAKRLAADVKRVTAWRARKLDFSDTPLAEAIAEANRYSVDHIILDAPDLEGARISGTFEAGKNDLLVEGLQSYFHLDARRTTDHHIVLTAASLR